MILDRKPLVYVWRPFYRVVFDCMVWPFLGRVKTFFFAESHSQLQQIANQISSMQQQLSAFEARQRSESTAFEQLYLCLISDPDRHSGSIAEALREIVRRDAHLIAESRRSLSSIEQLLADLLNAQDERSQNFRHVREEQQTQRSATGGVPER